MIEISVVVAIGIIASSLYAGSRSEDQVKIKQIELDAKKLDVQLVDAEIKKLDKQLKYLERKNEIEKEKLHGKQNELTAGTKRKSDKTGKDK